MGSGAVQPGVTRPHRPQVRDAKHPPREGPGRMRWQPGLSEAQPLVEAVLWAAVARLARQVARLWAAAVWRGVLRHQLALPAVPLLVLAPGAAGRQSRLMMCHPQPAWR